MTKTRILIINVVFGSLTAMSTLPSWWAVLPLTIAGCSLLVLSCASIVSTRRAKRDHVFGFDLTVAKKLNRRGQVEFWVAHTREFPLLFGVAETRDGAIADWQNDFVATVHRRYGTRELAESLGEDALQRAIEATSREIARMDRERGQDGDE